MVVRDVLSKAKIHLMPLNQSEYKISLTTCATKKKCILHYLYVVLLLEDYSFGSNDNKFWMAMMPLISIFLRRTLKSLHVCYIYNGLF